MIHNILRYFGIVQDISRYFNVIHNISKFTKILHILYVTFKGTSCCFILFRIFQDISMTLGYNIILYNISRYFNISQ